MYSERVSIEEILNDVRDWLGRNWDPDLTVGEWWTLLGEAGWAFPHLPEHAFGRGLARSEATRVQREIQEFGALGPPGGIGAMLAAPTIIQFGTAAQIDRYVRDIVCGRRAWCQLFSEPSAGSDLASLRTTAVRDGDQWVVNGQKVWTSFGDHADLGMLLARTHPDAPKHQGITWFVIEMDQPGVTLRPLRDMGGLTKFDEVFLDDAVVHDDAVVGDLADGWRVAKATLAHERAGLGPGTVGSTSPVTPGSVAGHLADRAGDWVRPPTASRTARRGPAPTPAQKLIDLCHEAVGTPDPPLRDALVRLHELCEIGRFNLERQRAERAAGRDVPGMANIAKLATSRIVGLHRDVGLRILGAFGTLHPYDDAARSEIEQLTGSTRNTWMTAAALQAQGPPIYGGTDQIQRNVIAERVLGLPRDPSEG